MRVLLVYPNLDSPVGVNHGLAVISAVLRAGGHETRLVHANEKLFAVPSPEELCALVRDWEPGVVGFSLMSQQYPWALRAARALKEARPDLPLVAGGVHCTMVPEAVVADGAFDAVAVGEAELAFREFVDRLDRGEDVLGVPNLRFPPRSLFNRRLTPVENPVGPFPDLNTLPPCDYELFDLERIVRSKHGWFGVLTSRGCPYKCTYCFNKEIVDRYVADGAAQRPKEYLRHYPVKRVISDLLRLKERHGVTTLIFDDDLFTLDRAYVRDFCTAYREAGVGLPFVINMHVQVFDDEMAFQLRQAGCFMVKFGLESGSARVRKEILWRWMSNERIIEAVRIAHRYGLHSSAFIMFGLPTETREEALETLRLCAEAELGRFRWALFFPFPGTAGHRIAAELDLIDPQKLAGVGNYFDGSCLRFEPELGLFFDKLSRVGHWWVNALSSWEGCAERYRPLVEEVESWDRETFEARRSSLRARDRALSEELLREGVRHYSLRYTHVMAVDSEFLLRERELLAREPDYVPVGYTLDD
ncbi:MAG: radical SAM protein [Planctomycetota bacterium]|nr:MAG: radical SAM protein [Planctomycetota bacterium]